MTALIFLWFGNVLEAAILWRGIRSRMIEKYPYFYSYVASTLSSSILPIVYLLDRSSYNLWYWPIQLATLVFGCGVILEILRRVLSPYPGAHNLARAAGLVAFGAVFFLAIVYLVFRLSPSSAATGIELERNVRAAQTVLLVAVLVIILRYRIPVGRNVLGMIVGYGLYIAVSLVSRAVEAYASTWLKLIWLYVQPLSFGTSLAIWLVALWSYHPNPVPDASIQVEADYEALAGHTRKALRATRSYIVRGARP
jgi:hypothetical protein